MGVYVVRTKGDSVFNESMNTYEAISSEEAAECYAEEHDDGDSLDMGEDQSLLEVMNKVTGDIETFKVESEATVVYRAIPYKEEE